MNHKFNEIKDKSRFANERPRLYIEACHKPPTISGNWVPTLARIAGADYAVQIVKLADVLHNCMTLNGDIPKKQLGGK